VNETGIDYLDRCWNTCGYGCSHGCETCWARKLAKLGGPTSPTCPKCQTFEVHFHPERLERRFSPARRANPAVVGVQFVGDLFDKQRDLDQIIDVLDLCLRESQHEYVFLTRQYQNARDIILPWIRTRKRTNGLDVTTRAFQRFHIGTTCTTQAEYDQAEKLFGEAGCNWWVSAEPLAEPIRPNGVLYPEGIIIGSDNQQTHDCGTKAIIETAKAFHENYACDVFVKQMWLLTCMFRNCQIYSTLEDNGIPTANDVKGYPPFCPVCQEYYSVKLVKDMIPFDVTIDEYDNGLLRLRELPWTLTTKAVAK
jgi:protein gp37